MTNQMRKADDNDLIRRGDVTAIPLMGMTVTQIERAIRAIPIAPQPVSVTVKPLVWKSSRVSDRHERFSANSPWGKYEALEWSDGTFGGTLPRVDCDSDSVEFSVESMSAAMAYCQADYVERMKPLFADPLSDPRVKALVDALKATRDKLASMAHDQFDGVWYASDFEDETREADAALRAIGGEA